MASITIRKLPENTKRRLRLRAARNGRSMEQEARSILDHALQQPDGPAENLAVAIHKRFAALGGVILKFLSVKPCPKIEFAGCSGDRTRHQRSVGNRVSFAKSGRIPLASEQPNDQLYTTAISMAEIFRGIELLPIGKRRTQLLTTAESVLSSLLLGRVLAFDENSARNFAL